MQKKTQQEVELIVLHATLAHFEQLLTKGLLPSETTIPQIRAKAEETHAQVFDHLHQTEVDRILYNTFEYVSSKFKAPNSQLEDATEFKEESEEIEIPQQVKIETHSQLGNLDPELKILDDYVNANFSNAQQILLPKREPIIILKKESDRVEVPNVSQPPQTQMTTNIPERRMVQKQLPFLPIVRNEEVAQDYPIIRNGNNPRMIQTRPQLVPDNINQPRNVQWPIFFLTQEQFEQRVQTMDLNIRRQNEEFRNRLLNLVNSEFRDYKDQLIDQRREDLRRVPFEPKITDFSTHSDIFLPQLQTMNRIQERPAIHGEIRIGNVKFQYNFAGREDIRFWDFTFVDRSLKLRQAELLDLLDDRFVSRVTGLLPKRRKRLYNHLLAIHKIVA